MVVTYHRPKDPDESIQCESSLAASRPGSSSSSSSTPAQLHLSVSQLPLILSMDTAQWRLTQGVGFVAGVLATSVFELEEARLPTNDRLSMEERELRFNAICDGLQRVKDRLYSGVRECKLMLPHMLTIASRTFDEPGDTDSAPSNATSNATVEPDHAGTPGPAPDYVCHGTCGKSGGCSLKPGHCSGLGCS
jgi:hypothetical protein